MRDPACEARVTYVTRMLTTVSTFDHQEVHMGNHSKKLEVYNGVSTADVPSAAWGWSELPKRGVVISGIASGLFLLAMLVGNHHGRVEDIYLIVLAVAVFLGTALWVIRPKLTQVRTITAHNRPVGHVEADWNNDQLALTGRYAELTDEELRALNIDPVTIASAKTATAGGSTATGSYAVPLSH